MFKKNEFEVGQTIRVKDGIKDRDFNMEMTDWHGRILELDPDNKMMLIGFDSITLRNTPIEYIETCEEEGLSWYRYNIGYDDVSLATARDTEADVSAVIDELKDEVAWSFLGPGGNEINTILAGTDRTDESAQLQAWYNHLEAVLTFPIKAVVAEWQPPSAPVKSGDKVRILGLVDIHQPYGILVRIRRKFSSLTVPLCDLEVLDKQSVHFEPISLYALWYANR